MSKAASQAYLAAWAAFLLIAACRPAPQGPAIIGYAVGAFGDQAVRVARDEITATQRAGAPAIVIVYDSAAPSDSPEEEILRAQRFVALRGLVAVVGPGGSRAALAVAPVYNDAGVPHIPPTSTSRLIAQAGRWTFALAPNDSVEGAFIARFVAERMGARRIALFYQNDEYGSGIRDGVRAALDARGVEVLYESPVDTTADFTSRVEVALTAGRPDVVVSGARWIETATIARLFARTGTVRVVAADGALVPDLGSRAGRAGDSIYIATFWSAEAGDSLSRAFVERYRRLVGQEPNGSAALNHDAMMMIVQAVREVGADRGAIRNWLLSLGRERPPYHGITGPIGFGLVAPGRLVMVRLAGGRPTLVADAR
jgi:branched-chain amino acid transport system substrate-binding protein